MKIIETEMEALVTPCRNENDGNVYLASEIPTDENVAQVVKDVLSKIKTNKLIF